MDKQTYLKIALKAKAHYKLDWIISLLSVFKSVSDYKYPYQLISSPTGYEYYDDQGQRIQLENTDVTQPLFTLREIIPITPEDIVNLKEPIETTVGRLISNYLLLVEPFGNKLSYINKPFRVSTISDLILPRLRNDPKDESERNDKYIYVSEYKQFANCTFFMTGLTQVSVWGVTEKVILPPDGIQEYRNQLLEQYKDSLGKASTIAEIEKKLIAYDKEYLAGDPGTNFLLSGKSTNIVRKKKHLIMGGEVGLDNDIVNMDLIANSLTEGWDVNKFPSMNNSMRLGSFARGAETMLGGVEVKWLLRASSNINVTEDDCGSKVGLPLDINETNLNKITGFSLVTKEGHVFIDDEEQAKQYIGKRVMVRSPMYCKLGQNNYCKTCTGRNLSDTPTGLSLAVTNYGSIMLSVFMSAAHSKALVSVKMDYNQEIF